jgi:DNA-binding LacI/PurR family transcriptional regulator
VGLVLRRRPHSLGIDPFYSELIAGMDDAASELGGSVLVHVVSDLEAELASYERWAAAGRISGVVLSDLVEDDRRADFLSGLGTPVVVLGDADMSRPSMMVHVDNYSAMRDAVMHLVSLGHRTIGRVSGPAGLQHTAARSRAFEATVSEAGIVGMTREGDYSAESGGTLTRGLLGEPGRPTAIVYDNDVMAVAGLAAAAELGVPVPEELSLLAWDDSALCRLAHPPLSVMSRDVHSLGYATAQALAGAISGTATGSVRAADPVIISRSSTAVAPARRS